MIVNPEAFSTINMIWASDAVSCEELVSCISLMAFSPMGVAALSRLSILAAMFSMMEPCAGWSLPKEGNNLLKKGPTIFEKILTTPPLSPTFMIPIQKVSTPVRPNDISKPVLAISKVEFIIWGKMSTSPKKISLTSPITNAIRKKNIHI
jgi:hypothetical protein